MSGIEFEQGLFGLNNMGIEFRSRGSGSGGGSIKNLRDEDAISQLSIPNKIRHFQLELESKLSLRKGERSASDNPLGISAEQLHESAQRNLTPEERGSFNADLTAPDD